MQIALTGHVFCLGLLQMSGVAPLNVWLNCTESGSEKAKMQ